MNPIKKTFLTLTLSSIFLPLLPTYAMQSVPSGNNDTNGRGYLGLKGGVLNIDDSNTSDIEDPMLYGVFLGYKFNDEFGVEVDYTKTSDADVTSKINGKGTYEVASYGMYLTYEYPLSKHFYAKSKLGVGGAEIDETYERSNKLSTDDVGIAGGIGLGYQVTGHVSAEGEFNMLRSDLVDTNVLNLGIRYEF